MAKIEINELRCKGCGICTVACPRKVIALREAFNSQGYTPAYTVAPDGCTGCCICAELCPDVAITVFK